MSIKATIVHRVMVKARSIRLLRQSKLIQIRLKNVPDSHKFQLSQLMQKELGNASRHNPPHLYGSTQDLNSHGSWGNGNDTGLDRARSDNLQVCMRGIALWIAVTYYETKDAKSQTIQNLQRSVLSMMREIREAGSARPDAFVKWGHRGEAA